jgi:sortase (surface protein transpeptidase)
MSILLKILVVIGIVIILIIFLKLSKKNPKRYYKKAMKMHKKGEECHNLGDKELAEEYYQDADYYRNKARELEDVV